MWPSSLFTSLLASEKSKNIILYVYCIYVYDCIYFHVQWCISTYSCLFSSIDFFIFHNFTLLLEWAHDKHLTVRFTDTPLYIPILIITLKTLAKYLCWGSSTCCIKLRIPRLWPAEWGGTRHPQGVSTELPFWERKNSRIFPSDGPFRYTLTKKIKSNFLTPGSQKRGGNEPEQGQFLSQVAISGDREQSSKPLLLIRWLGQGHSFFSSLTV